MFLLRKNSHPVLFSFVGSFFTFIYMPTFHSTILAAINISLIFLLPPKKLNLKELSMLIIVNKNYSVLITLIYVINIIIYVSQRCQLLYIYHTR